MVVPRLPLCNELEYLCDATQLQARHRLRSNIEYFRYEMLVQMKHAFSSISTQEAYGIAETSCRTLPYTLHFQRMGVVSVFHINSIVVRYLEPEQHYGTTPRAQNLCVGIGFGAKNIQYM